MALLYGFWGNFSCGTRRVVPSGQDSSILPAQVANHNTGFDSSCPLTGLASNKPQLLYFPVCFEPSPFLVRQAMNGVA